MPLLRCVCLAVASLVSSTLGAQSLTDSEVGSLAHSEMWLKQLYLGGQERNGHFRPRIHSSDFYFSDSESIDPRQELLLTREAVFANLHAVNDAHPACRFPGRFLFLNERLALGHDVAVLDACARFQRWAGFDRYDTLSVVMVEGYYGNPASSFGHLVLRHGRSDGAAQLLDTSINFGAQVPQGEGPVRYLVNGLTGGYQASFTAESYYRQDLVYTQVEQRDMWRYELALSDAQRIFFLAHLWELLDSPSTYYFLKNNCAFAVAEILEIVFEQELVNQNTLYYPPVTLFHELEAIERRGENNVIRAKDYIPSQHTLLRSLYAELTPTQRTAFSRYVAEPRQPIQPLLEDLGDLASAQVVEALIRYYSYLISGYPELGTELYDRRRDLIVARLAYPAGRTREPRRIQPSTEPGKSARVSRLSFSAVKAEGGEGFSIGWKPYRRSATDARNDDASELTLLSLEGRWLDETLETRLGLIQVVQRSDVLDRLPGEWPVSWRLELSWQNHTARRYQAGLQSAFAFGQSARTGPFIWTAMGAVRQSGPEIGLGGSLELVFAGRKNLAWQAYADYTHWLSGESTRATLEARYTLSPRWSVVAELSGIDRYDQQGLEREAQLAVVWHVR
ncbi:MAG: Lnb N-terminal periplasmic domain-containing protein [Saccharospirillum sp.]